MSTIRARIDARKKKRRRIRRHHLISSSFHSIMFASSRQKNGGILFFFSNNTTNVGGEQSFLVGRKMGVESNSLQKHLRHLGGVPEIRHRSSWPTSSCSSAGRKGNTRRWCRRNCEICRDSTRRPEIGFSDISARDVITFLPLHCRRRSRWCWWRSTCTGRRHYANTRHRN